MAITCRCMNGPNASGVALDLNDGTTYFVEDILYPPSAREEVWCHPPTGPSYLARRTERPSKLGIILQVLPQASVAALATALRNVRDQFSHVENWVEVQIGGVTAKRFHTYPTGQGVESPLVGDQALARAHSLQMAVDWKLSVTCDAIPLGNTDLAML